MPAPSQLKIKTSSCSRLLKEITAYTAEAEGIKRKLDSMIAENADEYDIKQQRRVLADSEKMLPDTQRRLGSAVEELQSMLQQSREEASQDDVHAAEEILALTAV